MKKSIALLIATSLSFAAVAQAKPAPQENPKDKKSKPAQQQQVAPKQQKAPMHQSAPKQHKAPSPQVQAKPNQQSYQPLPHPLRDYSTKTKKQQRYTDVPPENANKPKPKPQGDGGSLADGRYQVTSREAPKLRSNAKVPKTKGTQQNLTALPAGDQPKKPVIQSDTLPAVQSDKLKVNKTVKNFKPRHQNFKARVNPSVASVQFNESYRIRNAENWSGPHYNVFRTYRPQWHERSWWQSNHRHIILIGGGYYYWSSGYWYPAWGYDNSAAYYPYDGPIYVGSRPRPFDQVVADVQSILQEQGYYRGEVDGLVGPLTQEALAAYQSAQGLAPTAAIDQPTLESLGIS